MNQQAELGSAKTAKRRFINGTDDSGGTIASSTTKGFTEHEMLDDVGLVHMNGRVYDPLLARFGTPDPTTESPFSTQNWNRYSYVGNSPVNFTDPSGYCFMGCFWQGAFKAIGALFRKIPILGSLLTIAASALCGPFGAICGAISSAFVAGVTSGKLGLALKAGLISLVTAGAFKIAGDITGSFDGALTSRGGHGPLAFMSDAHIFNIASHAAIGCLSAEASGGKCKAGALSGAAGSLATPLSVGLDRFSGAALLGGIGGLASVAGGGKFENGAVTAAFGYLFNACALGKNGCMTFFGALGTGAGIIASGACDTGTGGACALANPSIVGAMGSFGAAIGAAMDAWADGAANDNTAVTHRNSAASQDPTELYYLINRASGAIDKIGITSNLGARYGQGYLDAENVDYVVQATYLSRYPALVDENIRLTFYRFENSELPRLNKVTR